MTKIAFTNRDGATLVGDIELPPGGIFQATALFAHCFTCNRNIKAARHITRALAGAGIAVLRFDFTGLGESEGDFADTSFASNLDDLEDAARWLAEHHASPQLLVGHSLGGTAVLGMAHRIDSVRAVATIGAPSDPSHVLKQFGDGLEAIERDGSAEVQLAGRPFRIRKDFVDDAREQSMEERLKQLKRALLVMHSPVDTIVSVDNAQGIFAAAMHPKSFISLDHADHLLSSEHDSMYAASVIAAWARHYLELDTPESTQHVIVNGRTDDGFLSCVQSGPHYLLADEPKDAGGGGLGLSPYEFLATALGTCTVMTLNMYARHKKLAVESVTCEVSHERVHAEDCADCDENAGKRIDRLTRVIAIEGGLSDDERARMLEIADRCPVHRTLEGTIRVDTVAGS